MTSFLHHVQINIDSKNLKFYKDLMDFLKWTPVMETESFAGFHSNEKGSVWFMPAQKNEESDYDKKGMNHLSLGVGSVSEVDECVDWLVKNNIKTLFDTPKHRPDFVPTPEETYYQVMFESPDKILFEIVYTGKK